MGGILIAAQMALTLAILCNALFIIEQRIASSNRPTGVDESNVFVIENQWVGHPPDLAARLEADLAALRALPGVLDAFASNSYVLADGGSSEGVKLNPDQTGATVETAVYYADEHAVQSLGLKLIAGRNFNSDEIVERLGHDEVPLPAVIITRVLANKLSPAKSILGQRIFFSLRSGSPGVPVVGIVEQLQGPWVAEPWATNFIENSALVPVRMVSRRVEYIVHARAGQLAAVLKAAETKLFDVNHGRVLVKSIPLRDAREQAYKNDRGLAAILAVVSTALVAVTSFGIVGLTSYWVAQRRRQIGVRRALGATRRAIVHYFQTENLMITAAGATLGIVLALLANLWMVNAFAMQRLHSGYALIGAIIVLLLGQAAVLWPALKAASIPPALVMRAA